MRKTYFIFSLSSWVFNARSRLAVNHANWKIILSRSRDDWVCLWLFDCFKFKDITSWPKVSMVLMIKLYSCFKHFTSMFQVNKFTFMLRVNKFAFTFQANKFAFIFRANKFVFVFSNNKFTLCFELIGLSTYTLN